MIVIDHRRSETARALRCEWLGIRPGTDGALALGLIHLLVEAGAYDRGFVERWTHGFEELAAAARAFTPDRVAQITGIPDEAIRDLALTIAAARGLSILMYTGLEYSNSGVQAIRAVLSLQALTGHLDSPGGKLFLPRDRVQLRRLTTPAPASARPAIGSREFPLFHEVRQEAHGALLPRAILDGDPYPVRGMIVSGSSLLTSWPDPARWRAALGGARPPGRHQPVPDRGRRVRRPRAAGDDHVRDRVVHGVRGPGRAPPPDPATGRRGPQRRPDLRRARCPSRLRRPLAPVRARHRRVRPRGHRHHLRRARREPDGRRAAARAAALPEVGDRRAAGRRPAGLRHAERQVRVRVRMAPRPRLRAAARLHGADRGPARVARRGARLPAGPQHRGPDQG